MTPLRDAPVVIRPATSPSDLAGLSVIESEADGTLLRALGLDEAEEAWDDPPSGEERASEPGYILVAVAAGGGDAVGFAHVLEIGEVAHLEQAAVLPDSTRRGIGRALVDAACDEARRRGHASITLRTYADVPFNAPFYRSCGFVEETDGQSDPFLDRLAEAERRIGLDRWGRRVLMRRRLSR